MRKLLLFSGIAGVILAATGGSIAVAQTTNTGSQVCVEYGHGADNATGNYVLYNWNKSPCPTGTYPETISDSAPGPQGPAGATGPTGATGAPGPAGAEYVPNEIHYLFHIPAGELGNSAPASLQELCTLASGGPGTTDAIPTYDCIYENLGEQ